MLENYEWLNTYPEDTVQHSPRTYSDHFPLLLTLETRRPFTQILFRFETIWKSHPEFKQLVRQV